MDTFSFSIDETANFSNKNIKLLRDIPIEQISSLLSIYKYLNLSNNNLTAIDGDFISKFVNISYLNVSGNKITKMQGIESLRNLQYLDVSNNEVSVIESMGNCNETLEKLLASHNNISSIFFNTKMSKLDYIDIRENRINKLSFGIFVPHLHTLKVDNNFLNDISGLSDFDELKVFSASSNQITEIPKLTKFSLRTINLSNNKISSLLFLNQPKLVTLDISGNPISDDGISTGIDVNKNLLNLFISSTLITRCHCLAKIFPYLSTVDLSKTKIDNLNDLLSFVHEMKNIKVLDVRFTPLTRDIYPGLDPTISGNSLLNQSSSFQSQQRSSIYLDSDQEKHYDSILIYNQLFPENSEERIRFRSEIIKSSISQLQILDHIKVSQSEYSAIESQPIKLSVNNIIEEEEEDVDNDYNIEYSPGIEEEEEELSTEDFSENKEEIQYKIEIKPPNQFKTSSENFTISTGDVSGKINTSQIDIGSDKTSTIDKFDVSNENEIEKDIQKVIYLQNANSSISNYSDNKTDDYSPSESLTSSSSQSNNSFEFDDKGEIYHSSRQSHHSSRHSHHSSVHSRHSSMQSHHSSKQIYNPSKHSHNSSFQGQNLSFQGQNSSFQGQSSLHLSSIVDSNSFKVFADLNSNSKQPQNQPFYDNPNLYRFLTHVSDDDDDLPDDIESESEETNENENENEDEKEEEEDDVMITTQIIAQTLSGNRQKDDIDKSIDYINRSVQAEIDSIYTERKKREHDEKMKKIKKLRKENKILEKEIQKYKMRKKARLENEDEMDLKNKTKSNSASKKESKHNHSHKDEKTKSKSKSTSTSKSYSKTQIQNSSKESHHHHVHSNSALTIKNSSKSKHHHHDKNSHNSHSKLKMPNENLMGSDHFSNSKIPHQKSSDSPTFSDSNSASNSISTSNSYIIKTKKKSISIEESEITPENPKNYDNDNDNNNNDVLKAKKKKHQKSSKDPSFKFPQIVELLDGLLAENEQLGGKIAASIKNPCSSTPTSPNQEAVAKNSHQSSFASQKVSSESKKSVNQKVNSQINREKSNSIIILSNEVNHTNLPQITREYAEQKILQSLKKIDHYSPLTENSKELKFLLLWLIEGLPFSADNIRHDTNDIVMRRELNLGNYNCNLTIKAADKNRHYRKFFESQDKFKDLQLLMLFNFNNNKSNDDCSKSFSDSGLDLDLMFNFNVDQIPQDAEFFKNINYLFKGMPPFLCITVCVVDLGKTKNLFNVKEVPTQNQQEKISSKGFNSICYDKNGLKHYILFDKAHAVPVYTLLFSTI